MKSFFQRLEDRVDAADSILCIGLDPHPNEISELTLKGLVEFCKPIIHATSKYAAVYKPNMAFFESLGAEGWLALQDVLALIPDEIPVLLDAKRGDIASTAKAYAAAAFEHLGVDAMTLNPLLGQDSIQPFLQYDEKGFFLLCKTSNPGADDFQNLAISNGKGTQKLYEVIAEKAKGWNTHSQIGLVIGATQIEALKKIRQNDPQIWLLVPGVGAQGGDLESALNSGLRADGKGILLPVSRAISQAEDPEKAASALCQEINEIREKFIAVSAPIVEPKNDLLSLIGDQLLSSGCVKFGDFTLKSGLQSPIYIDLRRLISYPALMNQVCEAFTEKLKTLQFDRIAGLPYAALPLATLIGQKGNWPMIYPRKEVKAYGTKASLEGVYKAGEKIAIIDDLATTGESKFEAIDKLVEAGLKVQDVVVLIDRQSGAAQTLATRGYQLHAVLQFNDLLHYWRDTHQVSENQIQAVFQFLETH
ncbi:MAG: orotidine-5'-phosphate decarboxylase [Anaerolineaceae bacterium]|nr:orotidine-5'-phosphate decarboxylase [Anaerolineaceae bacterium]